MSESFTFVKNISFYHNPRELDLIWGGNVIAVLNSNWCNGVRYVIMYVYAGYGFVRMLLM